MVGEVDRAVAVTERYTREVPEYEHEAPFLVVHIPSRDDHFLALRAGVGVEKVGHEQEADFAAHVAVLFVLARGR